MESDTPLNSEEILTEDLGGVSQDHLNSRDEELSTVHKYLKRYVFIIPRITQRISLTTVTEPRGHFLKGEWLRRVLLKGLTKSEVKHIYGLISEKNWAVCVNEMKTEKGDWNIEII